MRTEYIHKAPKPYRAKLGEIYAEEVKPLRCDQCEAAMVNGVFCHETGCPNSRKTWVADRQEWVLFLECLECGCEVEAGEQCTCANTDESEAN